MSTHPKALKPRSFLDGLRSFIQTEEQKLKQTTAEVEERQAYLRGIEEQYGNLLVQRDGHPRKDGMPPLGGVKNRLEAADAEFESYKALRAQMAENLRTVWWGNAESAGSPAQHGYAGLLALDAAIADYPNARKVIADELAEIEARIAAFEREHLS